MECQSLHGDDEAERRDRKENGGGLLKRTTVLNKDLIEIVKDKTVFTQSLEAIAMLTEASLILKKIDKTKQK